MDKSEIYDLARKTKQYRLLIEFGFEDTTTDKLKENKTFQFRNDMLMTTFKIRTMGKGSMGLGYIEKRLDTAGKSWMPTEVARGRYKSVEEIADAFNTIRFHYAKRAQSIIKKIFRTNKFIPNKLLQGTK